MGDFLRVILDSIAYLWPFRIVQQWERAGYYIIGRYWREVGPGCYPIVPWFCEVRGVSTVPEIVHTPRQDITLTDGTVVSFTLSAWTRVVDYNLAINTIHNADTSVHELLQAVCADKIASVDAARLRPEGRGRLLADLRRWVDEESRVFGVEVTKVRFTTFVSSAKTLRLLQDANVAHW